MTIRVRNLSVTFTHRGKQVDALRGIDLDVLAGETVAIIGRSGAGKSTFLRALSGLVAPTTGSIEVAGHTPSTARTDRAFSRDVGIVFQDHGLVRQLTARDNVLCGRLFDYDGGGVLRFRPRDISDASGHLQRLGLADRADARASKLSGGERQRVAIARLLQQGPKVALLDEPVASLDIHWADTAIRSIGELADGEATAVAVLHDLELVRRWATRVVWLENGEVAFDGDPEEACRMLEQAGGVPTGSPPDGTDDGEQHGGATTADGPNDRPKLSRGVWYGLMITALIAAYVWAALGVNFSPLKLIESLPNGVDFMKRVIPPDLSVVGTVSSSLIETLQMALIGTTTAAMVALPLSIAGANNVAPAWLFVPARVVMNTMRTIPSIIWGLFFVAIVGLGPFPGILALTFYAAGYLGKFYYESIESIDPRPPQALRSVGANRIQQFRWGVFPQVLPLLLGHTLYMLEYNVRAASILGIVGAGGIGFYLHAYVNNFQYPKAATAILLLLIVVTVIDTASTRLRSWIRE